MKFIVHIGEGKAGSTAIQSALSKKTSALKEQEIICDDVMTGHFCLPALIGKNNRGDNEKSLRRAKAAVQKLKNNCDKMPDGTVIISAESLFNLSTIEVLSILRFVSSSISDLKIVAYIRSPDEHYCSRIQQQVKGDSRFTPPDRSVRLIDRILECWLHEELCSDIIVRPFSRDRLKHGSVVFDFENVVGELTGKTLGLEDNSTNSTLSSEQMVVLQRFRGYQGFQDGKLHPASGALIKFFEILNSENLIGKKPKLNSDARNSVIKANEKVIKRLNDLFPDLAFIAHRACAIHDHRHWDPDGSVASVLEDFDEVDIELLYELIPFSKTGRRLKLNFGQIEALREISKRHGVQEEFVFINYFKYLESTPNLTETNTVAPSARIEKLAAELKEERDRRVEVERMLKKAWRDPIPHLFLAFRKKIDKTFNKKSTSRRCGG